MLDAAFKALTQMMTPPFRSVLLKSAGLAIAVLIVIGILLQRLLVWLTGTGGQWIEGTLGSTAHYPVEIVGWLLAIAVTFGLFAGVIFLMPAVTSLTASFFAEVDWWPVGGGGGAGSGRRGGGVREGPGDGVG